MNNGDEILLTTQKVHVKVKWALYLTIFKNVTNSFISDTFISSKLFLVYVKSNHIQVLRFWCVWDDRDAMFGQLRPFILHYFLVDDTIEVNEVRKDNDGQDPFPSIIGRQKIPKDRSNVKC